MLPRTLLAITVAVVTLTGCSGNLLDSVIWQVELSTDARVLSVNGDHAHAIFPVAVRNSGNLPAVFSFCSVRLERSTAQGWAAVAEESCGTYVAFEIAAGQRIAKSLRMGTGGGMPGVTEWVAPFEGSYRLAATMSARTGEVAELVSEPFELVAEVR